MLAKTASFQDIEPSRFGLLHNDRKMRKLAARENLPLQDQSFGTIGHLFGASNTAIQKKPFVVEKLEHLPKVFCKSVHADMLEHPDGCDFAEMPRKRAVINFPNGNAAIDPTLPDGLPGNLRLTLA